MRRYQVFDASDTESFWYLFFTPSEFEKGVMVNIIPIAMFPGLTGNMCFLIMMVRFRHTRSTVNYYLTSLAIADILVLVVGGTENLIPHNTAIWKYPYIPYGLNTLYCIFIGTLMETIFILHYFITQITMEILYALCRPIEHRRISSKRRTFGLISLSWFIGLSFCIGKWITFRGENWIFLCRLVGSARRKHPSKTIRPSLVCAFSPIIHPCHSHQLSHSAHSSLFCIKTLIC